MLFRESRFRLAAAVLLSALAACAPKQVKTSADQSKNQGKPGSEAAPVVAPPTEVTEASLRTGDFSAVEGLAAIHFDYDSASLKDEALATLKKNAEFMKANGSAEFRVAGYCDERGTIEYNLALGQKRAKQVREYYIKLGVPANAMATISFGKESPLCSESNEDCWARNRRAETTMRARTVSAGAPSPTPQ